MITCLQCSKVGLKAFPHHARIGWGRCGAAPVATFVQFDKERECEWFAPAKPEIVASRVRWAKKMGEAK